MSIKEQVTADWNKRKGLAHFPRSWYENDTNELPIVWVETLAAGCITTYLSLEAGEKLDEWRIGILTGCCEDFVLAQPLLTDDEGKYLLELYLRMSTMVLVDCGVEVIGGEGNMGL